MNILATTPATYAKGAGFIVSLTVAELAALQLVRDPKSLGIAVTDHAGKAAQRAVETLQPGDTINVNQVIQVCHKNYELHAEHAAVRAAVASLRGSLTKFETKLEAITNEH